MRARVCTPRAHLVVLALRAVRGVGGGGERAAQLVVGRALLAPAAHAHADLLRAAAARLHAHQLTTTVTQYNQMLVWEKLLFR